MSNRWVLNASPLILFARVERLDLIETLTPQAIVPDAVIDEIRAGATDDRSASAALAFAQSRRATNLAVLESVLHWDLGAGESQVIAHALHGSDWAVLDDLAARRCAATHQIRVIGSIGIVLRAKRSGLVEAAAPLLLKLKFAGMYAAEDFIQSVLASVGENL